MAELATPPENSWHHMTCRLCMHSFDIAITDPESDPIPLCQTCSILIDWLGQEEEAGATPNNPHQGQANKQEGQSNKQAKGSKEENQQVELADLLEKWGELWRSGEG